MGPQPFGLVIGRHAEDRVALAGDHAGTHGHVGCRDVRADDGERLLFAYVIGEFGEVDVRPDGSSPPEEPSGERVAPRKIVQGARRAGEQARRMVAVEDVPPEFEDIEHFDFEILGHGEALEQLGVVGIAQYLECLRRCIGGTAVA